MHFKYGLKVDPSICCFSSCYDFRHFVTGILKALHISFLLTALIGGGGGAGCYKSLWLSM